MTDEGKHITVTFGHEEYALHVQQVREIVGPLPVTAVPNATPHVLGVMNLRGKVVPVVDLAACLGLRPIIVGARSCVVVCHGPVGLVGFLVDAVVEVVAIRADDLEPPPQLATAAVTGLAKVKDRVVIVLDVDTLVGRGRAAA